MTFRNSSRLYQQEWAGFRIGLQSQAVLGIDTLREHAYSASQPLLSMPVGPKCPVSALHYQRPSKRQRFFVSLLFLFQGHIDLLE
jgi:hypothetical protein